MLLKKLDHYKTRFLEHFKAIQFAQKKKVDIKLQIDKGLQLTDKYGPQEFLFLEEVAELVIRARRALTYTYPLRFYLEGKNKQQMFDFYQGELEASLEKLNKRNEEDWQIHLDMDGQQSKENSFNYNGFNRNTFGREVLQVQAGCEYFEVCCGAAFHLDNKSDRSRSS